MKRLYIVVEGQTEEEFVRTMLRPYLFSCGIYDVNSILIRTSKSGRGGFVNYDHLKNTVMPLLKSQKDDIIVTTFVDYFRMPHNTPFYEQCMQAGCNKDKVAALEQCIWKDINDRRFVPYIQLHEFEALLFSDNNGFEEFFTKEQAEQTAVIVDAFENPEDINTHPQHAPSKRILAIKEDYNKPIDGNLIADKIGINTILKRCPRFAAWISELIEKCK